MANTDGYAGGRKGLGGIRPRDLLTISNMAKLPASLATMRKFMHAVNWNAAQEEVKGELGNKVTILGLPNSGKSTLFNTLRGQYLSPVSPEEGTTKMLVRTQFGPFTLIDTPGHLPDVQQSGLDEAAAVIYLLDASQGIRGRDYQNVTELARGEKPLVVVLNKADMLGDAADEAAAEAAARLHVPDVIPISARDGDNIAEELIPSLIEISPEAALTIGRMLPAFRRQAANKLVRTAALVSVAAGLEPIPLIDIPILLGTQIRMVMRIAALYEEPVTAKPVRELVATIVGGLALRYVAEEAAKMVPFGGDFVSGAIAGAATWTMGQVAIEYFAGGKQFSRAQINKLIRRFYRRYREEDISKTLQEEAVRPGVVVRELAHER